ncbi:hypothetical protein [Streptomyces sp. NBC_01689]|uniref:hypothetical protein n=1 Tax=Streptomyces sp. NBC_01689 TaxID=2975911 RepID=UPI002E32E462|nr:hypothetical protein [Streptomyces sp. NBC_01689]
MNTDQTAAQTVDADVLAYKALLAASALLDEISPEAAASRPLPGAEPLYALNGTLLRNLLDGMVPSVATTHPDHAQLCSQVVGMHAKHTATAAA